MTATPDAYFERCWGGSDDPWEQATRHYEERKYDLTAAMPRRARFRRVFEPGCATGLLTARLLERSDRVVATDRHPHAVEVTRRRIGDTPKATVSTGRIPDDWPDGTFDLIVLSEVLYYLDAADVRRCIDLAVASLERDGELVAVHYRVPVAEHALLGDEVHDLLAADERLTRYANHLEDEFVLEGFLRTGGSPS